MFDMFDSSNRGWLAKLIEEVEEDIVEEEEVEVVAAILESELVEIVLGSNTMKKIELRLNWSKQEYKITRKIWEWKKSEKQRANEGESFRIFCKSLLNHFHYQSLYLYIKSTITV